MVGNNIVAELKLDQICDGFRFGFTLHNITSGAARDGGEVKRGAGHPQPWLPVEVADGSPICGLALAYLETNKVLPQQGLLTVQIHISSPNADSLR